MRAMFKSVFAKSLLLSVGLALAVACSSEDEHDDDHGHGEPAAECAAIGEVCSHDVATALSEECHEIYHANDATVCAEREDECVSHCVGAAAAGGAGGEGGSH